MEWIYCNFYNKFYKAQKDHPRNEELWCKVLDSLLTNFFEGMNKRLAALLSLEELWTTTNSMAKGKAPQPYGVVAEFYTF